MSPKAAPLDFDDWFTIVYDPSAKTISSWLMVSTSKVGFVIKAAMECALEHWAALIGASPPTASSFDVEMAARYIFQCLDRWDHLEKTSLGTLLTDGGPCLQSCLQHAAANHVGGKPLHTVSHALAPATSNSSPSWNGPAPVPTPLTLGQITTIFTTTPIDWSKIFEIDISSIFGTPKILACHNSSGNKVAGPNALKFINTVVQLWHADHTSDAWTHARLMEICRRAEQEKWLRYDIIGLSIVLGLPIADPSLIGDPIACARTFYSTISAEPQADPTPPPKLDVPPPPRPPTPNPDPVGAAIGVCTYICYLCGRVKTSNPARVCRPCQSEHFGGPNA